MRAYRWVFVVCFVTILISVNLVWATEPQPHFLYVLEGNGVSGWNINSTTGAVAPNGQGLVKAGTNPYRVASDVGGYRLYVANVGSNDVSAYFINRSNGNLTQVPGSPFAIGRTATAVAVHPSGHFVFVTGANDAPGDYVAVFKVESNGSLSPVLGSPFTTQINPVALVADPGGHYLFVADSSSTGYIDAFHVDMTSGALTPVPGSPFPLTTPAGCPGGTFPEDIIENPAGTTLYTADAFDNAVSAFNVSETTGTLDQVTGSAFPDYTCLNPDIAFDPDTLAIGARGKFLYAGNGGAQTVSLYDVNSGNGALTMVGKSPVCYGGVSSGPILRSDPSGSFLFTTGTSGTNCQGNPAIVVLKINPSNGNAAPVPGSPFSDTNPAGPVSGALVVTQ